MSESKNVNASAMESANIDSRRAKFQSGGAHPATKKGKLFSFNPKADPLPRKGVELSVKSPLVSQAEDDQYLPFTLDDESFNKYDSYEYSIKSKNTGRT